MPSCDAAPTARLPGCCAASWDRGFPRPSTMAVHADRDRHLRRLQRARLVHRPGPAEPALGAGLEGGDHQPLGQGHVDERGDDPGAATARVRQQRRHRALRQRHLHPRHRRQLRQEGFAARSPAARSGAPDDRRAMLRRAADGAPGPARRPAGGHRSDDPALADGSRRARRRLALSRPRARSPPPAAASPRSTCRPGRWCAAPAGCRRPSAALRGAGRARRRATSSACST